MAREIGRAPELDAFRGEELEPGAGVTCDEAIDQHLRRTATTVSHAAGTCRMGVDDGCVLDPQLRVHGIEALRVIDASVFPDLVSAHINAAVYMVAEKAADLLRGRT
jgi:4-pyridoxate dehydrogenase